MATGGTLGLVNDLSVKLQKQRKQLNALVKEVKSAQAAELHWVSRYLPPPPFSHPFFAAHPIVFDVTLRARVQYDYAGIIVCNNLLVVLLGFTLGSLLLGVGPSDGSFHAGQITAMQLTVRRPSGDQEVMVQSTQANSTVGVKSLTESSLVIAGSADDPRSPQFKWSTPNGERLILTQGLQATPDLAIQPLIPGINNVTDVCLSPGGGQGTVIVSDNLYLTGSAIATRNGSLTMWPALDANIEMRPTAGGRVDVHAPVYLEGRIKVSLGTDTIQFDGNPRTNTVDMGVDGESKLTVHGTANLSSSCAESQISSGADSRSVRPCHIIDGGNLNILKGNMILGKANIVTEGQLSVAGDVNFGSSANDTLEIQGAVTVTNGTMANVAMDPLTGSIESNGNLYVDQMAELRSSVAMGSKLSDSVDIKAQLTSLHHLNASGSATLGSLDSHDVLLFGNLTVVANASVGFLPILSVDGIVGDVFSDCDLHVTSGVHLDGSVAIGMPWSAGNASQVLTVSKSVDATFHGPVHLNQSLQVDDETHLSDAFGEECVLRGPLGVGAHAEDFTVDHSTGNVYVHGDTSVEKSGVFLSNVSMGQGKRHLTVVGGDTRMRSTLHSHSSFSVGDGMTIDGELNVGESLLVTHDHSVVGDVYLGSDAGQRSTVHGRLAVETPAKSAVLDIEPSGGDITVDGRLTVQGETELDGTTTINASATVNGAALLEASLRVDNSVIVAKDAHVGERITVNEEMTVAVNLTVDGPVILGSGPQNDVEVYGHLSVQAEGNYQPLLSISPLPSGVHITDTFLVQGSVRFEDKVDLGHTQLGPVTVLAATLVEAPMDALGDVQINGNLQVREHSTMDAAVTVHSDTVLGHRDRSASNVITVAGDLVLMDDDEARLRVSDASGDVELWSDLQVHGNVDLGEEGTINTPRFVVGALKVKEIRERTTDEGVTVEGVVFVDGGIKMARVHEMREELPTKGVTVEGANCKAGALVLTAGSGTNNIDALTLTNQNHAISMANTSTRLAWKQYFHDSRAGTEIDSEQIYHSAAGAAAVAVTTVGHWTEEPSTHNAKIGFETVWKGVVEERARILPEGHFVLGGDAGEASVEGRVVLDSAKGDFTMAGNLYIGAGMYSCAAPSATGPGLGNCNVCSACCMELEQNECDSCVMKHCANNDGTRSLDIVSEAEQSSLVLQSGGDGSTTITLTSGATTEFESPASFSLINTAGVGTAQSQPSLRLVDSQTEDFLDLLVLSARPVGFANVGDLYVAGSMIIGELNTTETQRLEQSVGLRGGSANLTARSMGAHDASVVVTSGPNQRAYLKLQDPADGGQGSGFWLFNDGTKGMLPADPDNVPEPVDLWKVDSSEDTGFPTMRISNDMSVSLLSVYDQGDSGSLQLNGDFEIGQLDGIGARMLRVQSSAESAIVNVIAGAGADAQVSVAAGANQRAVVLLEDPDGKFFSIGPHTESPTLMFGWGADAESEHALVNITRTSHSDGLMHVSGSGIIGTVDMQAPCALGVVSGAQAELSITAGDGEFGASATLISGPDQSASLVLSVQSAPDAVGTPEELYALELANVGSAATPMLQLIHKDAELLTLTDEGERGDLAVSGNLILGDRSSDAARSLAIESQARADLIVVSGIASDSVLQVMSGAGQDAQFRLEDTTEGNAATFSFKNSGSDNALKVVDATNSLMLAVYDKGEVGDLEATGDALFGDVNTGAARALTITAGTQANLDVMAGLNSNADISLLSATGNTAAVELRSSNKTGFRVHPGGPSALSGTASALRIAVPAATDASSSQLLGELTQDIVAVIDRGPTGDLHCSGDVVVGAIQGEKSYTGDRWLKLDSHAKSSLAVHSGDFDDASVELLSGPRQNSALRLEQLDGAVFEIGLNHASLQSPSLDITDGNANMMVVTDRGSTGNLLVTGNGAFGSAPDSLGTVLNNKLEVVGSYATLDVVAGVVDTATLTLSSGPDATTAVRLATHDTSFYELRNVGDGGTKRMEIHSKDANILQVSVILC